MRRTMVVMVSFLAVLFSLKNANAQTSPTGGDAARPNLSTCIAELNATREQLNVCQGHRAPNGDICAVTLGAQLIDGRCQCPPVLRHNALRPQAPVPVRLPNGNTALACGTPHYQTGTVVDRAYVERRIHSMFDPLNRRVEALEQNQAQTTTRVISLEERQAEMRTTLDNLRQAMMRLCRPLEAQAQPNAPAVPATSDTALIAACDSLRNDIERESQALTRLTATVGDQGTALDQLEARVRELEATWHGVESRFARRLLTMSTYLGVGVNVPLMGTQFSTVYSRLGLALSVPIASSPVWSFIAQGEGGIGYGGLGTVLAFGGRIGVNATPENSAVGVSFGITGRNFWTPWERPPEVASVSTGTASGWSAGVFVGLPIAASRYVEVQPWLELGGGRYMGQNAQHQYEDHFGVIFGGGVDLVFHLNR